MYDSSEQVTTQTITVTGTSAAPTNAFAAQTRQVRLVADTACNYAIGDGVQTASTASPYLPANWYEYLTVHPGQKIAAIRAATDGTNTATSGTMWVTELT